MSESFQKMLQDLENASGDDDIKAVYDITDRLSCMDLDDPYDRAERGKRLVPMHYHKVAAADFQAAISAGVEDPRVYFDLGAALSALGKPKGAVSALRGALRLLPDSDAVVSALAWEMERMGLYNKALAVLRNHKKNNSPWNITLYQQWGRIRGRQGKWRQAYVSYVKSMWLPKPGPGATKLMLQKYKTITKIRRLAKALAPENQAAFFLLGELLLDAQWTALASDVMGTAALMKPDVNLYTVAGIMREKQFQSVDAIRTYKEGIRLLSDMAKPADIAPLYEALMSALFRYAHHEEALNLGARVVSLGAATPKFKELYESLQNTPIDADPITSGNTAPPYLGNLYIHSE